MDKINRVIYEDGEVTLVFRGSDKPMGAAEFKSGSITRRTIELLEIAIEDVLRQYE